jgi:DNA polymerase III subunit delta
MAEKNTVTFDSVMSNLRARHFSPIYYLIGEESYYIDQISDFISENVLTPEERDFNQTVVFGSDVTAAQVVDLAKRYPMMSEYQVVIVKEAQSIKNMEALEFYLQKPMTSTILVICHKNTRLDRKKKLMMLVDKVGVLFESRKLYDNQLIPFIEAYLRKRQVNIEGKAAQIIADSVGADLNRLTGELDKLLISLSDNDLRITPETVENQIGVSKDFNVFELRTALVNRHILKANQIVKYFDENPKEMPIQKLLPQLFNLFSNLMLTYYAPVKNENGIASFLELTGSPWKNKNDVREYMIAMKNYSGVKVMGILSKLRETDAKSKGVDNPNTSSGDLMKELIFFILH